MFNICFNCGEYRVDKIIDPVGPYAICPLCGYKHSFAWLPLRIISGASGSGKTTVCQALLGKLSRVVLLDSDILWRPEFNSPETNHRDYFETWLRMCKNISQSGRPVVLFGAGVGVPQNLEPCVERRYFSSVHYLALTSDDDVLAERLRKRPAWRKSSDVAVLEQQVRFNQWFKGNASITTPAIDLLDTTHASIEQTTEQVNRWIDDEVATL
jgi:predicted kinase